MAAAAGILLALVVLCFARLTALDRDRAFYPMLVMVIASVAHVLPLNAVSKLGSGVAHIVANGGNRLTSRLRIAESVGEPLYHRQLSIARRRNSAAQSARAPTPSPADSAG
ncbi:MAG: hypothetical protein IRZ28_16700 [Steroidobacteraceae bacterium]|nr:hypothetical protein [Steroidobacteraceae bacterium]